MEHIWMDRVHSVVASLVVASFADEFEWSYCSQFECKIKGGRGKREVRF